MSLHTCHPISTGLASCNALVGLPYSAGFSGVIVQRSWNSGRRWLRLTWQPEHRSWRSEAYRTKVDAIAGMFGKPWSGSKFVPGTDLDLGGL